MTKFEKIERADVDSPEPRRTPSRWRKGALIALPAALLVWGGYELTHDARPAQAAPPPPTVTVATPLVRPIEEWDEYVGRFAASKTVDVRPRVSGEITGVHFTDGAIVHKGDLLFSIDRRPFQARLAEAQARVASAKSDLALAKADLSRAMKLVDVDAVSQSQIDQLRAKQQASEAALAAAQADVRARALDLSFTQVRAPITGRVSDRKVDAGNLVGGGEGAQATLLTTINALDPIYFSFDASEALFLKTKRSAESGEKPATVDIKLQDENQYRWHGRLDFTDNGLDPDSGTIRIRAVVSNPKLFLTPGMFGDARLSSGGRVQALLVPDAAVTTDQARKLVMTVDKQGKAQPVQVELGPVINGLRVIRSDLTPETKVVISDPELAMPGTPVKMQPGKIVAVNEGKSPPAVADPTTGGASFAAN